MSESRTQSFWRREAVLPRVFFWSGVSALFFQVAWQRLLTLNYGVGSVSIALIVSTYMLGLGLGSLLGGHLADFSKRRVEIYVSVELGLALYGLVSLPLLQWLGNSTSGAGIEVALLAMGAFLLVPTVCMGMTLPLVVKLFDSAEENSFLNSISFLYATNTLGATLGCLLSSFVVVSFLGLDWAVYIASAIDLILAGMIFFLGRKVTATATESAAKPQRISFRNWDPFFAVVTGFLAIGYEILWMRLLQVLLKSSPYTFSAILAVYLTGIGLGSYAMSSLISKHPNADRRSIFFLLQVSIGLYVLISIGAYYWLTNNTDVRAITAWVFSTHQVLRPEEQALLTGWREHYPWLIFLRQYAIFVLPAVFVFAPTILMGGTFPLLSYLSLSNREQQGQTVGAVYFLNTLGNVLGGIVTGFVLLNYWGTETTFLLFGLIGLSAIFLVKNIGVISLSVPVRAVLFSTLTLLAIAFFPHAGQLWYSIHMSTIPDSERQKWTTHMTEGEDAVVFVADNGPLLRNSINGLTHGARGSTYMFQRETLEALANSPKVDNVLVIGFGAGATIDTLLRDNRVKHVTLVEICRSNLENLRKIESINKTLNDPRMEIVVEDGRRCLQANKKVYDLILIDPLRSTEAYSNNIYSRQFMQLLSEHLENGLLLVWLDNFDVLPNTIWQVFPQIDVYNYFCLASKGFLKRDSLIYERLLATFPSDERDKIEHQDTKLVANQTTIKEFVGSAKVNEDWRPITEYYFGTSVTKPTQGK